MGDPVMATTLVVLGSVVFLLGAATGVPRVFTEPDPASRLRLIEDGLTRWRVAQPLYAVGPLTTAVGVGCLAASVGPGSDRAWLGLSGGLLLVGALSWSWSAYQRGRRPRAFALGELPGGPFTAYVWLTLGGLAALGTGLLVGGFPAWTGVVTLSAGSAFLVAFLRYGDIPPFVFYLLLPVVSLGWP